MLRDLGILDPRVWAEMRPDLQAFWGSWWKAGGWRMIRRMI
jgi:hypothetical protein